jgi:hypothetical protein
VAGLGRHARQGGGPTLRRVRTPRGLRSSLPEARLGARARLTPVRQCTRKAPWPAVIRQYGGSDACRCSGARVVMARTTSHVPARQVAVEPSLTKIYSQNLN